MEAAAMRQRTLRAMELGGALAGAPAGGVSKPCAMLGRLLSISTLRGALPGLGRPSAASECSGGLRGLRVQASRAEGLDHRLPPPGELLPLTTRPVYMPPALPP